MCSDDAGRLAGRRKCLEASLRRHLASAKLMRRKLRERGGSPVRIAKWGRQITRMRELLAQVEAQTDGWERLVR